MESTAPLTPGPADSGNRRSETRRRTAVYLAWTLGGLSVAMFVLVIALASLTALRGDGGSTGSGGIALFVPFLAFPVVGTLIATKVPQNAVGWVCLAAGIFWMYIGFEELLDDYVLATTGERLTSNVYVAVTQGLWVPPVGLLGVYMILLFPDGRLPSRRWRPLAWSAGVLMAIIVVSFAVLPGPLVGVPGERNPLGVERLSWMVDKFFLVILLLPLCILASAASLVFRFRRARGEVREQIKWLALAACVVGVTYFVGLIGQLVFAPGTLSAAGPAEPQWVTFVNTLTTFSYAGVPVAVGIAVLKYRLYDIEVIVNRALVYGSLSLLLLGTYLASVVSLQYAFRALAGGDSQLAVVASTLAIAALFVPLKKRIQNFIDRRFYRRKYDSQKVLDAFSARLRDETDLETLSGDLDRVVKETMKPSHMSVWFREPDGLRESRAESRESIDTSRDPRLTRSGGALDS